MATAAAIAAAAIGAAGSVAGGVLSSQGAQAAARAGRPSAHQVPLAPYQRAFAQYYTRWLANNMNNVAPTFADFVKSGGTATFPINDPGFTPRQAQELGMVGPKGQQIPFVPPGSNQLTPEQQLYLGYELARQGKGGPLAKAYRINQRIGKLEGQPDTGQRDERISKLRSRRDKKLGNTFSGELN